MKIEKVVGQNMAALRAAQHWSQPEFGRKIGEVTRKPWSRQAVSNAENGLRSFTAADLVAIAYVYETSPAALLALPPASAVATIEIGDVSLPRDELEHPDWQHESTSEAIHAVVNAVRTVAIGLDQLQTLALPIWRNAEEIVAAGIMLEGRVSLEEKGAARPGDFGFE